MSEYKTQIESRYPHIECLLVVESGSRAWDFASPDSDWDIRFIYAHRGKNAYLKLGDPQEVIIFADGIVEYHGWDIKKALKLAAKSNVSFYEWAASPVVYDPWPELLPLCEDYFSLKDTAHHYRGLARHTYAEYCAGTGEKTLKKFLYVIRPILCIEFIISNSKLPPIDFNELMQKSELDDIFKLRIAELLEIKTNHPEKKIAPKEIDEYFSVWCKEKLERLTHDFINQTIPHKETDWQHLNSVYNSVTGLVEEKP